MYNNSKTIFTDFIMLKVQQLTFFFCIFMFLQYSYAILIYIFKQKNTKKKFKYETRK